MNDHLLGFLLNALEPEEHRLVEKELEASPESRDCLARLRQALQPLETDRQDSPPPAGLAVNAMKRVAEFRCQNLPSAPMVVPLSPEHPLGRTRWRRIDVLVAASIAALTLLMIPPGMLKLQHRQQVLACANNLRSLHAALAGYEGDRGVMPHPEPKGPLAVAGSYAVLLHEAGWLKRPENILCPADIHAASASPQFFTRQQVEASFRNNDPSILQTMGGCYGYYLGFVDDNGELHYGNRRTLHDKSPVMADRPPRLDNAAFYQTVNSPNHSGLGQNVLFYGGNVRFLPQQVFGGDDIFHNFDGEIAAGRGQFDSVLGASEVTPLPVKE